MTSADATHLLGLERVESLPKGKAPDNTMTLLRQRFQDHLLEKKDITEGQGRLK